MLLPFLTGKPLEASLLEAERADDEFRAAQAAAVANDEPLDDDSDAAVAARSEHAARCGAWRSPQRSETAYVRCLSEALHYLLARRGVTPLQAKQVHLALRAQVRGRPRRQRNDDGCLHQDLASSDPLRLG